MAVFVSLLMLALQADQPRHSGSSAKTASDSTFLQVKMTLIDWTPSWIPPWIIGAMIMIGPAIIALLIYRWFIRRLIRLAGRYSPFLQKLLARGQGPASAI